MIGLLDDGTPPRIRDHEVGLDVRDPTQQLQKRMP